jgi:antitoxin (DNA-binding transcriptional repressor) of toxin-antitoxin stability system
MEQATISQLKNRLSAYLRLVKAGKNVLILDRDEPIATLEPIKASQMDARLKRLRGDGVIRPARGRLPLDLLRDSAPKSKRSLLEALLEERREGR